MDIGIDIGSSYIKAFLIDAEQGRIADRQTERMPERAAGLSDDAYELDPGLIAARVRELIRKFVRQTGGGVEGLFLSVQMHGFVYSEAGRADRYVSWQDTRCLRPVPGGGTTYLEFLKQKISREDMLENGVYLKPSMGLCNLFALLQEDGLRTADGTLYTLGSYLIHSLTGRNIAHAESLAPVGILNVKKQCLAAELLETCGLSRLSFPEVAQEDFQVCGIYQEEGCRIRVYPDYGDMQTAVLGSSVREGEVVINTATAAQVIRPSAEFLPGPYEIRPYFGNRYLYTISDMPSGRNLQVLIHFIQEAAEQVTGKSLSEPEVWETIHALAGEEPEGLRVDMNFYRNSLFPGGGAITGISRQNLRLGTLFAAAYQNMAETYWDYIRILAGSADRVTGIVCAGGVNWKTPELVERIRRVSGKPCRLSAMKDEAAAGLLSLAVACREKAG